jgi:predicted transport protein
MINIIYKILTANDGEQDKDNNNDNVIKYLESNKDNLLDLAEKYYESLVEALTNNAISAAASSSSSSRLSFVSFLFLKSKLKAYLNIEIDQVHDPLKKARDVKDIGHYSSGKTEITIKEKSEIPYALSLIKQAYERS